MEAGLRRKEVLNVLEGLTNPISVCTIAKRLNVSRHIIACDIEVLNEEGHNIVSTARGYIIKGDNADYQYLGKFVSSHCAEETRHELYTIVDLKAVVINVIIEHQAYGLIRGGLHLANRKDVDAFLNKFETSEMTLLSELTQGIHMHTIGCRDKTHFEEVCAVLEAKGFLQQKIVL